MRRPTKAAGAGWLPRRRRRAPPSPEARRHNADDPKKGRNDNSTHGAGEGTIMILPQVHLRKPCYDFSFL